MNLSIIISIISAALCILMFFYFTWYVKKRTSESGVLKETRAEVKELIKQVNLSIAAINEATDRNLQLVEDRIIKLKEIIDDTDKRISVYVKEVEKSKTSEAVYTQLGRGVRAAIKAEPAPPVAPPAVPMPAPALSAERPNLAPPPAVQMNLQLDEPAPPKPPSKKQIRVFIDQLANEGLPENEIASRLGISVAEVELAMRLMRKKA